MPDVAGWNLDPKAIEFEHAKTLQERNRHHRPKEYDNKPDDLEYEKGAVIRRLREGDLERGKVKDIAGSLERPLHKVKVTEDSMDHYANSTDFSSQNIPETRLYQDHLPTREDTGRKFSKHPDYIEPNAMWGSKERDDACSTPYRDSLEGYYQQRYQSPHFTEAMKSSELVYAESPVPYFDRKVVDDRRFVNPPQMRDYGYYPEHPPERTSIPRDYTPPGDTIYESLQPSRSAPDFSRQREGWNSCFDPVSDNWREMDDHEQRYMRRSASYERSEGRMERDMYQLQNTMPSQKYYIGEQRPPNFLQSSQPPIPNEDYRGNNLHNNCLVNHLPFHPNTSDTFVAQNRLELRQRKEQGKMFRDFDRDRQDQVKLLEERTKQEMKTAVDKLLRDMDTGMIEGDMEVEKLKIEDKFCTMKQNQLRMLMRSLSEKERVSFDNMVDKHAQEMLELIDKKVPAKLPSPKPPTKKKNQLYSSPSVFDDIDFHAVQVAQKEYNSFTELVYDLTSKCRTQLQKTRAIFRWIAVKDLNQMMFREELTEDSPYYFLKGIKYGLESYHELFKRLCSYAGLSVKIIRGLSKSAGYRPGTSFIDSHFRNSWAVVLIDDNWHFVDCHWGARHVNHVQDANKEQDFCYSLDEFYFLTDPDEMIYMHYPDDPDWQLLEYPVSMEGFVGFPVVKSYFFHYGLAFEDETHSVIESPNGTVEICIKKQNDIRLAFNTRLEQDGKEIDGYCIHQDRSKTVIFNLVLPNKGVFFFTIFACDTDKSDAYNNVCAFRIKCLKVENKPFAKFPRLPCGYGLTDVGRELGLKAEKFDEYYIVCRDDKMIMNVKFNCAVKVSQKLISSSDEASSDESSSSVKGMENDRLVFQRYIDKNFASFVIRFPKRGIFVFSVYAAEKTSDTSMLDCACRYLIQCNTRISTTPRPYPKMLQYWYKCRLHEPTIGELKLNKNVKFKLEVPKADAVAVIVNQQWFYLKKDDEGKTWEGAAHTGKDPKAIAEVYARFKDNESDFYPLLEYTMMKSD